MLFTGHAELNIDAKGRLAIPAKYRSQWDAERDGPSWVCVPWPRESVRIYPERVFAQLADSAEQTLTPDDDVAELEAALFGLAEQITPDAAGRVTLSKEHLRLTGLGTEVVVVGVRNRLEVRDREVWRAAQQQRFESLPSLVARVERRRGGA